MLNKTKIFILISIIPIFVLFNSSFAYNTMEEQITQIYNNKIINQLPKNDKLISFLETLDEKITTYIRTKKLDKESNKILYILKNINLQYLNKMKERKLTLNNNNKANITVLQPKTIESTSKIKTSVKSANKPIVKSKSINNKILNTNKKKQNQINEINRINKELNNVPVNEFLNDGIHKSIRISKYSEFIDNNKIQRINFSNGYKVDISNVNSFSTKQGIFVTTQDNIFFVSKYTIEQKISYPELQSKMLFTYKKGKTFFLNNNIYYSYSFSRYLRLNSDYGVYLSDLPNLGLSPKNTLLYYKEGKYYFIKKEDYKVIRLVSSNIIKDITNKTLLLNELKSDNKKHNYNLDSTIKEIKQKSLSLIKGKNTKDEKIQAIYNWILKNITYTKNVSLTDYKIFSGVETFINKDGVCEGYAKLTAYMLLFAGVNDVSVIRGYVIEAKDFPNIGHAWLRIGNFYYDPTFDDPTGSLVTKKYNDYLYYKLPKDLLYANRFEYTKLPKEYRTYSKSKIKNIIFNNLSLLTTKYKKENYNLLRYNTFLEKYNIKHSQITTKDILQIIPVYTLNKQLEFYNDKNQKKAILKYNFMVIDDNNIENIVRYTLNYTIDGVIIFKVLLNNDNYEYRLSQNITYR